MSSRFIPHSSMYQNAFLFKLAASGVLKTPQVILMMCHQGWDPLSFIQLLSYLSLTGWCSGKESTANARNSRDKGSMPGSGRSPGAGHGNPLQYFFFSTPVFLPGKFHRQRSLRAAACGVAKSQTQLSTHPLSYADEKTEVQREEGTFTYPLSQHILTAHLPFPE